jgi:hypothetical protein
MHGKVGGSMVSYQSNIWHYFKNSGRSYCVLKAEKVMANIFNDDFKEFINCFNQNDVAYVLVGGMAVILNGYNRTTGDMDVWVKKTTDNYERITKAFRDFSMPVFDMTKENFLSDQFDVWSFGRDPVRIDVMTEVKGLDFDLAFRDAQYFTEDNTTFRYLHLSTLIEAKRASGRHRDMDDIEQLSK